MTDFIPNASHTPIALVTGAGSGIGRAIAVQLAADGFTIALVGRHEDTLRETLGLISGRGMVIQADVGDPQVASTLGETVTQRLGTPSVIVNNAGIAIPAIVGEAKTSDVLAQFATNAIGPTLIVNGAWAALKAAAKVHGRATVVSISSMATVDPFETLYAYAPTKGALNTLTLSIRNAGRTCGIRAFAIAPGAVETAILRSLVDEHTLPRNRRLEPEVIARVVADCVRGAYDARNGETIIVPSP